MNIRTRLLLLTVCGPLWLCSGQDVDTEPKSMETFECRSYEFRCRNDSKCIPDIQKCDGIVDCDDKSDEGSDCVFFTCEDGRTISSRFLCDGFFDCADESDESANCTKLECANGKEVSLNLLCDGIDDCNDKFRSDECDCEESFTCANEKCIQSYLKCDGIDDCGDNSDETLCFLFTCSNGKAVGEDLVCDGIDDCGDTSDECDCPRSFKCKNDRCINSELTNNGIDDCGDGSDENAAQTTTNPVSGGNYTSTTPEFSGQDVTTIRRNTLMAKADVTTQPTGTTKHDVTTYATSTYSMNATTSQRPVFACVGGKTVPLSSLCDEIDDCNDGFRSDECDCDDTFKCMKRNGEEHFKCIPESKVCDGADDCGDEAGSDECGCPSTFSCNTSRACIHKDLLCDGIFDCDDYSDELPELAGCNTEFECDNGDKTEQENLCDGIDDCGDCSDEIECKKSGSNWETYDMYFCLNGSCVRDEKICDGVVDCLHGDDESDCDYDVTPSTVDFTIDDGDVIESEITTEPESSPTTKLENRIPLKEQTIASIDENDAMGMTSHVTLLAVAIFVSVGSMMLQ